MKHSHFIRQITCSGSTSQDTLTTLREAAHSTTKVVNGEHESHHWQWHSVASGHIVYSTYRYWATSQCFYSTQLHQWEHCCLGLSILSKLKTQNYSLTSLFVTYHIQLIQRMKEHTNKPLQGICVWCIWWDHIWCSRGCIYVRAGAFCRLLGSTWEVEQKQKWKVSHCIQELQEDSSGWATVEKWVIPTLDISALHSTNFPLVGAFTLGTLCGG